MIELGEAGSLEDDSLHEHIIPITIVIAITALTILLNIKKQLLVCISVLLNAYTRYTDKEHRFYCGILHKSK
jgi:hypothetical protein